MTRLHAFPVKLRMTYLQVLTPLSWPDLLWVAALPGISEELLFRGALIPALFPDWWEMFSAHQAAACLHRMRGVTHSSTGHGHDPSSQSS